MQRIGLRLLGATGLALACVGAAALIERMAAPPDALRVRVATFGHSIDPDRMQPVALPHRWREACADCRTVWYRLRPPVAAPPRESQALYLPAVGANAAVYLNGRLLGQGGRFAEPMARLGRQPLWVAAPILLWRAEGNDLYVLVKSARPHTGLMPAPALGAETELRSAWQWRVALATTLPQVLATATAMLALVMGALAYYRRSDRAYLALAATAGAYALHAFSRLVVEPPWSESAWDAWLALTAWSSAAAVFWLIARLLQARLAPIGAALALLAVAAAVAAAWEPSGWAADAALLAAGAATGAAGLWLAATGLRRREVSLAAAGSLLVAAALLDLVRLPLDVAALPTLPWGHAAFAVTIGWGLLARFVDTLNAAELLNVDLEALVRERTAELQAQFERVRELQRREAIAAERERLMRDMHDGVGGHLVSLLAMLEADRRRPGELAVVVREALDDMRLMIDSLDPVDDDLNAVLAMFRDRLLPRLQRANVVLHWEVETLPAVPGLTPARVLHVLRILQEAVTNAIRHGCARNIAITARAAADRVQIDVRDDGAGFDPHTVAGGRGLKNMRRRAAEIGAELSVNSAPGRGAAVTLALTGG